MIAPPSLTLSSESPRRQRPGSPVFGRASFPSGSRYGYISLVVRPDPPIRLAPPRRPLDETTTRKLHSALAACPDIAFAHLVDVEVEGLQDQPNLSLFVWLMPEGVGSLRASLNLVSETVANVIPKDRFIDVLILNSAPELLEEVEKAGCLFVERDAGERRQARQAAKERLGARVDADGRGWWRR